MPLLAYRNVLVWLLDRFSMRMALFAWSAIARLAPEASTAMPAGLLKNGGMTPLLACKELVLVPLAFTAETT